MPLAVHEYCCPVSHALRDDQRCLKHILQQITFAHLLLLGGVLPQTAQALIGSLRSKDELAAVHQVVAQTKAVEEEVQGTEALVRSSAAEKDALSQKHEELQSDLSDLMSKNQVLERENATMRAHALKRAKRQIKVIDACPGSNILEGIMTKVRQKCAGGTAEHCVALMCEHG